MVNKKKNSAGASRGERQAGEQPAADRDALSRSVYDPIGLIEQEHALQLIFCDRLEEIADQLPNVSDLNLIHTVLRVLNTGMVQHVQMEEHALFPALLRRSRSDAVLAAACAELEKEHGQDADLVVEIIEELQHLEKAGMASNAEMLGYMLRGYFSGQRRHIDWENNLILPLARKRFLKVDLEYLKTWMIDNDHRRFTDFLHLAVSADPGRRD